MTSRVFGDSFQAYSDCEPQQWKEGILVPNAVHVVVACLPNKNSGALGAPKKGLQNAWFYLHGGHYFLRRACTRSTRIWSNVRADEPCADPARSYFLNWFARPPFESSSKLRHHDFIHQIEVIEALADTPSARSGLPV